MSAGIHLGQAFAFPVDDTAGELFGAIESSVQPVCIYRSRKYLYANRAYARLLGFGSPKELLLLPDIIRLIYPDDRPMASREAKARIAGGSASDRHEFRMMRRDGSIVWVETVGSHIKWIG
jgi:PAS domain S-box-containing protein